MTDRFLAALPFWMILAYGAAWWTESFIPAIWMEFILVGGIGVALVLGCRQRALLSSTHLILAAMIAAWLIWNCASNFLSSAPVCSWWKTATYLVSGCLCMMIATARHNFAEIVEVLGSACCLTMIGATAIIWHKEAYLPGVKGGSFFFYFGFGHPNLLVNTAGLGCFPFLLWVIQHQIGANPRSWALRLLAFTGVCATLTLALALHRRGVMLGLMIGLMAVTLRWCWTAYRRTAIAIIGVGFLATLALGVWLSLNFMHVARAERMLLYGGMIEIAAERPLTGSGSYAARRMHEVDGENSRHFVARGEWPLHGHNEPLDAFADGGFPALILLLMSCGWIFRLAWQRHDPRERNWLLLSIGGVIALACVDNAYARITGLWYVAILAGLAATSAPPQIHLKNVPAPIGRQPIRITVPLIAGGLVALMMAWSLLPASQVRVDSPPVNFKNASEALFDPELLAVMFPHVMDRLPVDDVAPDLILDQHQRRIGNSKTTTWYAARRLEELGAPNPMRFENIVSLLRIVPFNRDAWTAAAALAHADPRILANLDVQLKNNLQRINGDLILKIPSAGMPCYPIDAAASAACALRWCLQANSFDDESDRTAERLIDSYGDVSDVGILVCDLLIAGRKIKLTEKRIRIMGPAILGAELYWAEKISNIDDPRIAQRMLPLFAGVYLTQYTDILNGHITRGQRPWEDSYLIMHQARCRLWSLRPKLFP